MHSSTRAHVRARRAIALLATTLVATTAQAGIDKYYVGSGGLWQTGPWSTIPGGPNNTTAPGSTDNGYLNSNVGYTVTTNASTSISNLGLIQIDSAVSTPVGLDNSFGANISCGTLVVGAVGQGSLTSGGGATSVGTFIVGQNSNSNGTVVFGNTNLSISSSITIGAHGSGQFEMDSGTLNTTNAGVPVAIGVNNLGVANLNGGAAFIGPLLAGTGDAGYGVLNLNTGATLTVQTTTTLGQPSGNSGAGFFLNGGAATFNGNITLYRNTGLFGQGAVVTFGPNVGLTIKGGQLQLNDNIYTVSPTTPVTITDGTFGSHNIVSSGGASINFNGGTVAITNSDFDPAANPILGNGSINLTASKALTVVGTTQLRPSNPIVINGGTFSTVGWAGSPANVQFNSGTMRFLSEFDIGTSGFFGDTVTLDSDHRVEAGFGNYAIIQPGAQLVVNGGALIAEGNVEDHGYIQLSSPTSRIGGNLFDNFALIAGTGRILAPLLNEIGGEVRVNAGDTMRFESPGNANGGLINLNGGYADFTQDLTNGTSGRITGRGTLSAGTIDNQGSILLSAGLTDVHGAIDNESASKVIVSGAATATFYDNVTNETGSEFRVSTNSTAVFFGTVTGLSEFTGPGLKDFEGATLPGAIVSGGATLVGPAANVVAQSVRENSLSVEGNLSIVANGTSTGVSRVSSLDVSGGKINLANNALVVDYTSSSPLTTIRSLIISGRAGGTWTGPGITSSLANNASFGVGYAEASAVNTGSFLGQTVDNTTVLVRFTRYGDGNLDGVVNAADFTSMAMHFNKTGALWSDGDFNYDGIVNALDFNYLASNFGQSLSSPSLASLVPEPLLLTPAALMLLLGRRRK